MKYYIDGYNLIFRLIESKQTLQIQRDEVIDFLQKEFRALHLKGCLFFDGVHLRDEQSGRSYKSPLTIFYSAKGETADEAILERLENARSKTEITIVTDDRSLSAFARTLGAHTLTLKAFLAKLTHLKSKKKLLREERKGTLDVKESRKELDRLLAAFEQRLKDTLFDELQ
jgi:predicted RNA-binding protein with PIN domain